MKPTTLAVATSSAEPSWSPARAALRDHLERLAGLRQNAADAREPLVKVQAAIDDATQRKAAAQAGLDAIKAAEAADISDWIDHDNGAGRHRPAPRIDDRLKAAAQLDAIVDEVATLRGVAAKREQAVMEAAVSVTQAETLFDRLVLAILLEEFEIAGTEREAARLKYVQADASLLGLYEALAAFGRAQNEAGHPSGIEWLRAAERLSVAYSNAPRAEASSANVGAALHRWQQMANRLTEDPTAERAP